MESAARRTAWQAGGLVLAGAVAGGVLAAAVTASAASGSGSTQASPYAYSAAPAPGGYGGPGGLGGPGGPGPGGHRFGLPLSGTVSAVGGGSVTIKTADGTNTYAVDARSDIDKNGEAKLSDLKTGDAVRFGLRPGTSTIAVLHAGDEAKDRPAGGGHDGPCPGMNGSRPGSTRPAPTPTSTT